MSVDRIMWQVVIALLPLCAFAVYLFGLAALLTLGVAVAACVVSERLANRRGPASLSDGSVVVTGLIYGLTLPPGLPLWMTAVGGMIAVFLGKVLFGGLGYNAFNPALVGRAFLQAAFPAAMTTWLPALQADRFTDIPASTLAFPGATPSYDGLSGATPLTGWKFQGQQTDLADLALGMTSGSTGETCALLIGLAGLYLVARGIVNWRIPAAIFVTVAVVSAAFHRIDPDQFPGALFALTSGGLMLGAVFMATDPIASPVTRPGCWLYGALIGVLIVAIRFWSGLPEGVMYAILLGNAVAPHIDRFIQPRPFGSRVTGHG
jgi:electron transport complex protein RnfD